MSRIGKRPVDLPSGVEVTITDKNLVKVKGPKGELEEQISTNVKIEKDDKTLTVSVDPDDRNVQPVYGLSRSLINNMVIGVTEGFTKKLLLVGVGYRAEKKGDTLVLQLGFSHPVEMKDPEGIKTEVPNPNEIIVSGINKAVVGNYAANIRAVRPPEPYKGKGVKYEDEVVRRKEGKTGAKKK